MKLIKLFGEKEAYTFLEKSIIRYLTVKLRNHKSVEVEN